MVICSLKILNIKLQKQTIHKFYICPFWVAWWNFSMSCSILPSMWINSFSRVPPVSDLLAVSVIRLDVSVLSCLCSCHTFLVNNDPKHKGSDICNTDVKGKPWVLSICEKLKILNLRKGKKHNKTLYVEAAKFYGKNKSIHKIVKKEK